METAMKKEKTNKKKKSVPQKILSAVGIVVCIILLPLLIVNLVFIGKNAYYDIKGIDKIPDFMGYKAFIVQSGSMEPTILTGDLIIVKVADSSGFEVGYDNGSIISFKDENDLVVTHRLVDTVQVKGETLYITKGDNNNAADLNTVNPNNVEGIFIRRVPKLGDFALKLKSEAGFAIIVAIPILILLVFVIIDARRRKKYEREVQRELELIKSRGENIPSSVQSDDENNTNI